MTCTIWLNSNEPNIWLRFLLPQLSWLAPTTALL